MDKCEKWLFDFLRLNGTTLCDLVRQEARKQHFSKGELKAARKSLKVETFHQFDGLEELPNWFWSLPDKERDDTE